MSADALVPATPERQAALGFDAAATDAENKARAIGLLADSAPEKQLWIEWARGKADWLDPLVRRSDPILDAPEPEAPSYWQY